jgi:hypothetical protein
MLDITVTPEVADAIAEIGRVDPRYHSPEGVLFRKALALIHNESGWCQGAHERGDRFCISGAIISAHTDGNFHAWNNVRNAIRAQIGDPSPVTSIVVFNDHSTHAQVMSMLNSCGHANGWL